MYLVSYLAHDTHHLDALQERLALAAPAIGLVTARTAPDVINHVQTLPVRAVVFDLALPREVATALGESLRRLQPDLPIFAMSPDATPLPWWQVADELLRLDESLDLFLHRLTRARRADTLAPAPALPALPAAGTETTSLLSAVQFRQFAELFSGLEESALVDAYIAWVQQACQTSRAVLLLRDADTGQFTCRAQRGLPSTLVPHCSFAQTSALARCLTATARILVREQTADPRALEALAELDLLQADAAVPVMFDGQLVGILGIGPRLMGQGYSAAELEALFAIGGQIAAALHHCRLHRALRIQQEMTEHMLSVMPIGALVLGEDERIAFVNAAAAALLGKSSAALFANDLRALPSPLGDLAYATLRHRRDQSRQELEITAIGRPLAVATHALATTPPSALLLLEDLSAEKRLEAEHDRRVNLEVLTNLVHYLAHELRNPLVALSTFSTLAPERANDPDFKEFCESVLQGEIGRVNLILEQLLVLTDKIELQFHHMDLLPVLDRVTNTEEMSTTVVTSFPVAMPPLYADEQRLETALTCVLRTATRLSSLQTPVTMKANVEPGMIEVRVETAIASDVAPEKFLNPWRQFIELSEEDVDLGLATAQYIVEQHNGSLDVSAADHVLTIVCRLPLHAEQHGAGEEESHDAPQGARRRR